MTMKIKLDLASSVDPLVPYPRNMSRHMDFVGQRADKAVVVDILGVEQVEQPNGVVRDGVVKEVDHYTVSCNECDGDGYYDQRGEVICEGCGMVLSGEKRPVINTEYSEGDKDSMGRGRGLEKMGDQQGTHEPGV